jgi:hypothetical protein
MNLFKLADKIINNPTLLFVTIMLVTIIIQITYIFLTPFEKIVTVKEKIGYSSGKHMTNTISDADNRVYQVSSSLLQLHFKATEVWMSLEKNKSYSVKGNGLRIPILGLFPNIIKATPLA